MHSKIFIETPRLIIQNITPADFPLYQMQLSDPVIQQFSGGARTEEGVITAFNKVTKHLADHGFSQGPVFEKSTQKCIGRAGLFKLDFDDNSPYVEFSRFLWPEYWRLGFGAELATGLIDYAFDVLKVSRVYATADPANIASISGYGKLGMQLEKTATYHTFGKPVLYYMIERESR